MLDIPPGQWTGLDGLGEDALNEIKPRAEAAVKGAVIFAAAETKITLTGARHGRAYRVSRSGPLHIAAAPGEPPAVLFGNLRNSVGSSKPQWDGWEVSAEFGVGLGQPPSGGVDPANSYARIQEWGGVTGRGVRIPPHPYLEPTVLRIEPRLEEMLEADV
jgi:hypothetical protein